MSDRNIGKQLTLQLIVAKTKSTNLQSIKNLNLWGNQLENLSILQQMPNLQVISLSVNKISSLRDFRHCYKLQELYLRKNIINDIRQIKHIMKLPVLKNLWLNDNPCAQIQNFREIVIRHLPNLGKLDNNPVTEQQRKAAMILFPEQWIFCEEQQKKETQQPKKQNKQSAYSKQNIHVKQKKQQAVQKQKRDMTNQMNRNKNILMAVLSLMRELDPNSLQIVKREAQNLIKQNY